MFRRFISLTFVILILISSAATVYAADSIDLSKYGPVDLTQHMQELLTLVEPSGTTGVNAELENNSRVTKMFATLLSNNWLITRTVVFGFSGFDGAVNMLRNTDVLKKSIEESENKAIAAGAGSINDTQMTHIRSDMVFSTQNQKKQYMILSQAEGIADGLEELSKMPGFSSNNTIFMRVSYISFFILFLTFMIRIANALFKSLTGRDERSQLSDMLEAVFKLILFIIYIFMLKWGIMGLLLFSEMLRNVILGISTVNTSGELAESLHLMSNLKGQMMDMDPSVTILDMVMYDTSGVITSITSYICYLITGAIIFTMVLLGDVMMAITAVTGPLILAIAMIKGFEGWAENWITSAFTFSLYMPIAGLYMLTMAMIHSIVPNVSFVAYLTISYAFFFGAKHIPNLAEGMSGAAFATLATASVGTMLSTSGGSVTKGLKQSMNKVAK